MTAKRPVHVRNNDAEDDLLDFETSDNVQVISSFEEFGLNENLLRGVYAYGMLIPLFAV